MDILQLDSLTQSLAVTVPDQEFPEVVYWGSKLSNKLANTDLKTVMVVPRMNTFRG